MLEIKLRWAVTPDVLGEQPCALCAMPFRTLGGVYAWAKSLEHNIDDHNLAVCPSCVDYFAQRNPSRFPSLADYRDAARRYPELMVASGEEMMAIEQEDEERAHELYAAGDIS